MGFALFQAVRFSGPIFWVALAHDRDRLMPISLPDGVAERLHLIEAPSETDLWTVEKKLRVKSVGLIIAEPEKPMSLTAGRQLQLAAEAGQTTGLMMMMEGRGGAMPSRPAGNVISCSGLWTRLGIDGFLI